METLHIEDLIAIQKLYAVCVSLHDYASTVGAPISLEHLYNNRAPNHLTKYAIALRLECLMFDASRNPQYVSDIINALKEIANDLASYIR